MSRPSRPSSPSPGEHEGPLFTSPAQKADLEARNGLRQFDAVRELVHAWNGVLQFTADVTRELQRIAIQDVYACAGRFRWDSVSIANTPHVPPEWESIPRHVDDMCEYANAASDPIHGAAYLMWRCNWIHPFFGGNGRTSRALAYLALCVGYNLELPGKYTVADQIVSRRQPYYDALDAADAAWGGGRLDVSMMESLLTSLLETQLRS